MNLKKTLPALALMLALIATMGIAVANEDQPQPKTRSRDVIGQEENPQGHLRQNRSEMGWEDILANAAEVSPGVFYLGESKDTNGKPAKGYAFVHYAKGYEPKVSETEEETCYNFVFGDPISWEWSAEDYVINPTNKAGLSEDGILAVFSSAISEWESHGGDILGEGSLIYKRIRVRRLDNINSVSFGNLPRGTIAMNIIWYNPTTNFLVEWDQVYSNKFDWSLDCEVEGEGEDCTNKMDFQNIATHELGHAVGMGDLYTDPCSEQTMYGYATNGETKKRTLESGDITGLNILYNQ
ncbi:hypothetical protein KAI54_03485 [Candidatus Gracilibacteria bacterium]|nr:hypothetical protein [Candidatus Gracilibacteria bacterium]